MIQQIKQRFSDNITLSSTAHILLCALPLSLLFSKALADGFVICISLLYIAFLSKDTQRRAFLKQPINLALLTLWAWFIFSSLFAFHSVQDAFLQSLAYLRFPLFFFACTQWLLIDSARIRTVCICTCATVFLGASDAFFQFLTGHSTLGNPIFSGGRLTSFLKRPDIGIYLAKLSFPVFGFLLAQHLQQPRKLLALGAALFFIISVIFVSGERTATALTLLGLCGGFFLLALAHKSARLYAIGGIFASIGLFVTTILTVPYIHSRLMEFITVLSALGDSPYGKLYKASWLSWQEYGMLSGVGIRQFRHSCLDLQARGLVDYCNLHSHNIYLEILSESGVIGLIIFLIFIVLLLAKIVTSAFQKHNTANNAVSTAFAFAGLIVVLGPSASMSFIANWSACINWFTIAMAAALCGDTLRAKPIIKSSPKDF